MLFSNMDLAEVHCRTSAYHAICGIIALRVPQAVEGDEVVSFLP
jgi:hypothetical protein